MELVNDSLYEWNVKICRVDTDSPLAADLVTLKEREGKDHILLSFMFKDTFPFDPPFVRMVHPVLSGGYVLDGGALCMELMTPQVKSWLLRNKRSELIWCVPSGLELGLHDRSCDHADSRHLGEGESEDKVWGSQGRGSNISGNIINITLIGIPGYLQSSQGPAVLQISGPHPREEWWLSSN